MHCILSDSSESFGSRHTDSRLSYFLDAMSLNKLDMGAMRQAMAWKVKYRLQQADGSWKTNLGWDLCGAHPCNSGNSNPSGSRVKSLAGSIMSMGVQR